jgi:hypothetical protein
MYTIEKEATTSKEKEIPVKEAPDEGEEDPVSHSGRKSTATSINKELKRNEGQEIPQKVTEKEKKPISQGSRKRFSQTGGKNGAKFASNDLSKTPDEVEKEFFEAEKEESLEKEIQAILEKGLADFRKLFEASEKVESIEKEIQAILEKVLADFQKVFEASEKEASTEREMKAIPKEKSADVLAKAEKEMQAIFEKAIFTVFEFIPKALAALEERGYTEKEMLAMGEKIQAYFHKKIPEASEKEECTSKEEQAFFEKCLASYHKEFSKALEKFDLIEEEKQAMLTYFDANIREMVPLGTLAESSNNSTLSNPNKEKVKPLWTPKRKHKSKKKRW